MLLARANQAEQRLQAAEAAMYKLKSITLRNKDKLDAARKQSSQAGQEEIAQLQARLAQRTEEAEHAEQMLATLTQAQSAARVELEHDLQDLQSKVRASAAFLLFSSVPIYALALVLFPPLLLSVSCLPECSVRPHSSHCWF